MTWVKLSDTFAEDPRLEDAGAEAFALYVAGLCYCARQLTDGYIGERPARRLWAMDDPDTTIGALLAVGLWAEADGGYEVVGYLEDQPSAEQVQHQRALKKERQRRWREKKHTSGDASTDAPRDTPRDSAPPRPAPPRKGGVGRGADGGSADAAPPTHPAEDGPTPERRDVSAEVSALINDTTLEDTPPPVTRDRKIWGEVF